MYGGGTQQSSKNPNSNGSRKPNRGANVKNSTAQGSNASKRILRNPPTKVGNDNREAANKGRYVT
jgi:hypothetical protein